VNGPFAPFGFAQGRVAVFNLELETWNLELPSSSSCPKTLILTALFQ